MQLNFVGRNMEVTSALKTFTLEKFKPLEIRYDQITQINITFHIEHITQIAEATVHIRGAEIHATAKDEDMYKAINMLIDKLLGQIDKHKNKLTSHHD